MAFGIYDLKYTKENGENILEHLLHLGTFCWVRPQSKYAVFPVNIAERQ